MRDHYFLDRIAGRDPQIRAADSEAVEVIGVAGELVDVLGVLVPEDQRPEVVAELVERQG